MGLPLKKRLERYVSARSGATGNATFEFPPVTGGRTWVGTVKVLGAPAASAHLATVGDQTWGPWNGPFDSSEIEAAEGQVVTISSSALGSLVTYKAQLVGADLDASQAPFGSPAQQAAFLRQAPEIIGESDNLVVGNGQVMALIEASGWDGFVFGWTGVTLANVGIAMQGGVLGPGLYSVPLYGPATPTRAVVVPFVSVPPGGTEALSVGFDVSSVNLAPFARNAVWVAGLSSPPWSFSQQS